MLYEDRQRASSFGDDAEQYDRVRPTYPDQLIDDLLADGGRLVLDVGIGTGIVARLFVARGVEVLGVEPDPRMATVARSQGLVVEESSFERWDPGSRHFDVVVSGQAWHWVDPVAGSAKVVSILRPGGRVALFWNQPAMPSSLRAAVDAVYATHAPDLGRSSIAIGNSVDERVTVAADALRATGAFDPVLVTTYRHQAIYSTAAWVEQLSTHSDHRTLDPHQRESLLAAVATELEKHGEQFVMDYTTWLVSGRTALG